MLCVSVTTKRTKYIFTYTRVFHMIMALVINT